LEVVVDDYVVIAPQEIVSWVNFDLPLRVEDQPPFVFRGWEDGSTSKSRNLTISSANDKPIVIASFCLEQNSFCGKSSICCSGVCSSNGLCEGPPQTRPPFSTGISENEFTDVPDEDNVDDAFGDVPVLPGVGDPLGDDSVDYQSSSNVQGSKKGGLGTSEKWLLSLLTIVVVMFPLCVGLIYCRRGRSGRSDGAKRSLEDSDDGDEEQTPIVSIFTTPGKDPIAVIGTSISEGASTFTSAIWEKLAEENERRAKLRAKLENGRFASVPTSLAGTPETVAESPASTKSPSSILSSSIDETLVRLDDILSRTFQFSRSRRSPQSTPEKPDDDNDAQQEYAAIPSPESDMEDVYLDTSSQLLLPLGDSAVPDSPLREDPASSFAVDTVGYSFVSSGLEDGLNDSAVHISDNHSVHSGSGRLLCHDPTVPTSLLDDASDEESATDPEFFPNMVAEVVRQLHPEGEREEKGQNDSQKDSEVLEEEGAPDKSVPASPGAPQDESDQVPLDVTTAGESTLEPPSFFDVSIGDASEGDAGEDTSSDEGRTADDSSDDEESPQIEPTSFYSGDDSSSGHSLV
jgi:hypothetical protein